MAILLMVASGFLGGISNLCMRRCLDVGGMVNTFLLFQLFFSLLAVLFFNVSSLGNEGWNTTAIWLGFGGGVCLGCMKLVLGKAIEKGPSALTFAIVNSASVFPALAIVLFLNQVIECHYAFQHALGSILVLIGLFWAGVKDSTIPFKKDVWVFFAMVAFVLQVAFLLLNEWNVCLFGKLHQRSFWFVPLVFATAFTVIAFHYGIFNRHWPSHKECFWGMIGGLLNGACACFFTLAIQNATPENHALIFPVFSIALIIACNLWGQWLYQEKIHWIANGVCLAGLMLAALETS